MKKIDINRIKEESPDTCFNYILGINQRITELSRGEGTMGTKNFEKCKNCNNKMYKDCYIRIGDLE